MNRIVPGIHSVIEVLRVRPSDIKKCYLRDDWKTSGPLQQISELFSKHKLRWELMSRASMDKKFPHSQGVVVEVSSQPELNLSVLENKPFSTLVATDGVEDPQNLGSIVRLSWLLAADGVLIPQNRQAQNSPAVNKVASGGCEYVPIEVVTNLQVELKALKERGYWAFGLSEKAQKPLWDVKIPEKVIWVLGGEEKGIRSSTLGECDELVKVPQTMESASLNVASVCAIVLSETLRQRR